MKMILRGGGGGRGAWSPQQLPNASGALGASDGRTHSGVADQTGAAGAAGPGPKGVPVFFNLVADRSEHHDLAGSVDASTEAALHAIVAKYQATGVPQKQPDPACGKFKAREDPEGKWVGPWCD